MQVFGCKEVNWLAEMRCNACWQELEGRAVATSCSHIFCSEDANKILSNDGACPICDQVLSKSLMKPVDLNPNDEWTNTAMYGISPQNSMKSAYKSIMFYIGQRELEMQVKMNKIVAQFRQKCDAMQEKFSGKFEQVYAAYQETAKRCKMMEQDIENLTKDNKELHEKFAEKCRQKRKLDEMYDQARSEIDSLKGSAIQPVGRFFSRQESNLFPHPSTRMDNRDSSRRDWSHLTPDTPGPKDDIWPTRQNSSNSTFDVSGGSPAKQSAIPKDNVNRMPSSHPSFTGGAGNPSMTLRNLILSPIKRPQLSRNQSRLYATRHLHNFYLATIEAGDKGEFILASQIGTERLQQHQQSLL
ncbi:E3 ubiquitin-protein ligase CCNB1IP1 homolog isoform X2 [Andrographis paniculata]|uniref:E3 ubiquitin-protein ligase CCNB1IP1 homolog isoform X2 n=1 Tax=Andrographis paniculata TaxID=175694 RepID=UPI0021E6EA1A|nr:E3 ubiquitin-protein ligase CCNB1IP1 homolog isoform X2 [Andrographis paniculata]